jgi:hypothetical protein
MKTGDLRDEEWRVYDNGVRAYRIDNPVTLYTREGGTTHRVVDKTGIVHCVVAPSADNNVVIRWKPRDLDKPVAF